MSSSQKIAKKNLPVWFGLCVCLSICLSVCLSQCLCVCLLRVGVQYICMLCFRIQLKNRKSTHKQCYQSVCLSCRMQSTLVTHCRGSCYDSVFFEVDGMVDHIHCKSSCYHSLLQLLGIFFPKEYLSFLLRAIHPSSLGVHLGGQMFVRNKQYRNSDFKRVPNENWLELCNTIK